MPSEKAIRYSKQPICKITFALNYRPGNISFPDQIYRADGNCGTTALRGTQRTIYSSRFLSISTKTHNPTTFRQIKLYIYISLNT